MFEILTPAQFLTSPWRNGGGVTHEIAKAEQDGRWLWRLSVAEVASDGPFSHFPGMARILTVIEGAGMVLDTPDGPLAAQPLHPVGFSGETSVVGRLLNGQIRDLNVIYDPLRVRAEVRLWQGEAVQSHDRGMTGLFALSDGVHANGQTVPEGAMVLGHGFTLQGGQGLLLHLDQQSPT
ncbi:HutD/Ves family protein [Neogemmobacter tilapiae]|uniref:HutD family protein n=1 Tax=Neogemmobacter tilapiae TaxID=875041 RepID=A0A918WIX4_9RHOB|nr:HutD family protein [Gemmobacter tilapiae]GHC50661.1 hypothetical protein GCM10007315_11270 [Gemmobacter tilapiae]